MPLRLKPGLTLYFCRHGETEANVVQRYQGITRDTPLTEKGRAQARSVGEILTRTAPDIARIHHVSSPLGRARATHEIVRETLGLPASGYATDHRLQEINLGVWEGLTYTQARHAYPQAFEAREQDKWNIGAPGGESYAEVAARAQAFVEDLAQDTFSVSHGVFTRVLRGLFGGLGWREIAELDEPQGVLFRVRDDRVEELGG